MSGMFSSEQHKFSRLTGAAKRKKGKKQTPNQDYLVLFISSKQAASSAGLAPFKPLCSHRKRTKPLNISPYPAPWDVGHLRPSSKPEVPWEGECTDSSPTNRHSTLLAAAEQRRKE